MIDIHSHILMGIDDGSRTLEESIDIIKEAETNGFTQIISTSHYYKGKFEVEENKRKELLETLNKELVKQNINVKLYLASEILITPEIIELIETKKASTINDTKYLLMELPFNTQVLYLEDLLFKIIAKGYVPIIAHPERYTFVQKNPNKLIEYIEQGALFQSNYSSVIGYYGKQTQKTAIKLLKANMIHFLGTDVHRPGTV